MMPFRDKVWQYWLVTDVLLIVDLLFDFPGLALAIGLTMVQIVHFYWLEKSLLNFAVQVRIAYWLLLLVALWSPMYWLIVPVIVGTTAMVLVNYCFLARFMSLMPWNHRQPMSWSLIIDTFFSKPVAGSVQKE